MFVSAFLLICEASSRIIKKMNRRTLPIKALSVGPNANGTSTRPWPLGSLNLIVVGCGPCAEAQVAKGGEGVVGVTSPCADAQAARGGEGGRSAGPARAWRRKR
ncbi:hypothetical protein MUK42_37164 [Musa troglodytarum]|uniref:Uncharacterized protein n=1 Tax=Musa troglodytarum TaxID=320322 RepID=A0A9E7G8N2_9LILI|nr:hypothetical protein MUK42_37164 [Musa troglodytarum]